MAEPKVQEIGGENVIQLKLMVEGVWKLVYQMPEDSYGKVLAILQNMLNKTIQHFTHGQVTNVKVLFPECLDSSGSVCGIQPSSPLVSMMDMEIPSADAASSTIELSGKKTDDDVNYNVNDAWDSHATSSDSGECHIQTKSIQRIVPKITQKLTLKHRTPYVKLFSSTTDNCNAVNEVPVYSNFLLNKSDNNVHVFCTLCNYNANKEKFLTFNKLADHVKSEHSKIIEGGKVELKCPTCNARFHDSNPCVWAYKRLFLVCVEHMQKVHQLPLPGFVQVHHCHLCNFTTLVKMYLGSHVRSSHREEWNKLQTKSSSAAELSMEDDNASSSHDSINSSVKASPAVAESSTLDAFNSTFNAVDLDGSNYTCCMCLDVVDRHMSFVAYKLLIQHIQQQHLVKNTKGVRSVKCHLCTETWSQKTMSFSRSNQLYLSYIRHRHQEHALEMPPYVNILTCPYCSYESLNSQHMRTHVRDMHEQKSNSKCKICHKTVRTSYMARHMASEHKMTASEFVCQTCGTEWKTLNGLRWHMKRAHKVIINDNVDLKRDLTINSNQPEMTCSSEDENDHFVPVDSPSIDLEDNENSSFTTQVEEETNPSIPTTFQQSDEEASPDNNESIYIGGSYIPQPHKDVTLTTEQEDERRLFDNQQPRRKKAKPCKLANQYGLTGDE